MTKEQIGSVVLVLAVALIGVFLPEYGEIGAVKGGLLNIAAMVAMVMTFTQGTKELIGYEPVEGRSWIPKWIAGGWSIAFGLGSFFTGFGMFAVLNTWYEAVIASIFIGAIARNVYDEELGQKIIKFFFGHKFPINDEAEEED